MTPVDLTDIRREPTYTNHLRALARLKANGVVVPGSGRRVVVLSDLTVEPFADCLAVRSHLESFPIDVAVCPPQEFASTVLDAAGVLYEPAPDVALILISPESLLGDLSQWGADGASHRDAVSQALQQFVQLLEALRARSQATLLVANFVSAAPAAMGLLDWQVPMGRQRALDELNHGLADWARQQSRVYIVDLAGLCAAAGQDTAFDQRMFQLARQPFSTAFLPRLAEDTFRYISAALRPPRKCLILDLDNTMWGGVLAEEGIGGLRLGTDPAGAPYREFQRVALSLHQRGILLAVCSRNDEAEALSVFREHPDMVLRPEHITTHRIGWVDKARSIISIAEELNLGLDAMVFLDDDSFERDNIRERLPDVLAPDLPKDAALYADFLRRLSAFDTLQITDEDLARGRMYKERSSREALKASATSLEEYLTDLHMEVTIVAPVGPARQRLFQLVHKTNRFNLTTHRYTEAEFDGLIADPRSEVFGVHLRDRLGDSGIIGVVVLRVAGDIAEIETLLLSCRVLGRNIETAILSYAADRARERGAAMLQGRYARSAKNDMVADLYARHGFTRAGTDGDAELWRAVLATTDIHAPAWARVRSAAGEPAI